MTAPPSTFQEDGPVIVSVNSRGNSKSNTAAKVAFVLVVLAVLAVAALIGINRWRSASHADAERVAAMDSKENKPAAIGVRRLFAGLGSPDSGQSPERQQQAAADLPNVPAIGDGRIQHVKPIPLRSTTTSQAQPQQTLGGQPAPSRYAGDTLLAANGSLLAAPGSTGAPGQTGAASRPPGLDMIDSILSKARAMNGPSTQSTQGASPVQRSRGALTSLLSTTATEGASARFLDGQRLVIPKGRSIDCALTMKLVSDLSGLASCELTQNVYSADGTTVLLERGSEATGEYGAGMLQGQRRLFVMWTRVRTPAGVTVELASPAADALGTSGLGGYVDNHWWERIGAAFMLSLVQDAVAYKTRDDATTTLGSKTNATANTERTGQTIAEQVLANSINIKPTLYRNQGERGSIYVARDLDFRDVYALRAR